MSEGLAVAVAEYFRTAISQIWMEDSDFHMPYQWSDRLPVIAVMGFKDGCFHVQNLTPGPFSDAIVRYAIARPATDLKWVEGTTDSLAKKQGESR